MQNEIIIKGQIQAKSERNNGIMVNANWYNAVSETAKVKLQTIEKGDNVEFIIINQKDIVDFVSIKKQTMEDIVLKLRDKIELLAICKGEVDKVFKDSDQYKDLSPLVAIIFRSIGGDKP